MQNVPFVDIHAHMDDDKFDQNREQIIQEFLAKKGTRLITVIDPYSQKSLDLTKEMMEQFPTLCTMAAAHPHQASHYSHETEKRILALLPHNRFVGIGEAGLDFHYNLSPAEIQAKVFHRQIALAAEAKLPLLVHSRSAEKEILAILEKEKFSMPVIFHCYTGNPEDAREILKRGYYLSFSGIITFKKAGALELILQQCPLDKFFLESDSPYLAPEPYRGQCNSPLFIPLTYQKASVIKGIDIAELQDDIISNFQHLFGSCAFSENE